MIQTITAVYEEGRLRPLQNLDLRENETVQIQIIQANGESEAALAALVRAGLVQLDASMEAPPEISEERRREVADALGADGPVSDLIIQDRGSP